MYKLGDDINADVEKVKDYLHAVGPIQEDESKIVVLCNFVCDEAQWELCGLLDFDANKNNYTWM